MFVTFPISTLVIMFSYVHQQTPPGMTINDVAVRFVVISVLTFIGSVIVHLVIEAPFTNLTKMIVQRKRSDKRVSFSRKRFFDSILF